MNGQPLGISVTRNNLLLVTIYNLNKLREYTTQGVLQREISLDASITGTWHSILLPDGNFIVSHEGGTHRVCIVNASGTIIHQYGGAAGSTVGQLYHPRGLALDKDGYVYISNWSAASVRVLSPTLTHFGDVTVTGQAFNVPYSLHLDELNGRLYISETTGARVFVLYSSAKT